MTTKPEKDDEEFKPFKASDFASSSTFKRCLSFLEDIKQEIQNVHEHCSIHEFVVLEDIEMKIKEIEETITTLQRRNILFIGANNCGKSFLLNLLFLMTCVEPKQYVSYDFDRVRRNLADSFAGETHTPQNGSEDHAILKILHTAKDPADVIWGLEALRMHEGAVNVMRVNPITQWEQNDPDFARNFMADPSKDHKYLLARYREYFSTQILKKKGEEKHFPNYLLLSTDLGKSTTIFCVKNMFGCTFHLCIEFFSEDEILGRAQDWIEIMRLSIEKENPEIAQSTAHEFLRQSFETLFPNLADRVSEATEVGSLPKRNELLANLNQMARNLAKQRMHIFAGSGKDFHRDRLFVMRMFHEEIGIGTTNRTDAEMIKCFMIKSVKNYVPSYLLASGCSLTDTPGTGDRGSLQMKVIRDALLDANVVVAFCDRVLNNAGDTFDVLFKDSGAFGFAAKLLKSPKGKCMVIMHYTEKIDSVGVNRTAELLHGSLDSFTSWQQGMDQASKERAVKALKHLKTSIAPEVKLPEDSITVFTAFPNLYASLVLNTEFCRELSQESHRSEGLDPGEHHSNYRGILDATQGHQFFALPEILEQKQLRKTLSGFCTDLVSKKDEELLHEKTRIIFSDQAKVRIAELAQLGNAKSRGPKEQCRVVKDLLDQMGGNAGFVRKWQDVKVDDTIEVLFSDSVQNEWYDAKVLSIDSTSIELVYVDTEGKESLDEHNQPWTENHRFSVRSDGTLFCKKLKPSKEASIDTIILQFSSREGIMEEVLQTHFDAFGKDLDSIIDIIQGRIKEAFEELHKTDVVNFELNVLSIFSHSGEGKSPILNLIDQLLKAIDAQVNSSFSCKRPQNFMKGKFEFDKMLAELRKKFDLYSGFFAERIQTILFDQLCQSKNEEERASDLAQVKELFQEYMQIGKKSLQERVSEVFALQLPGNMISELPDYDFISNTFRMKGEAAIKAFLNEMEDADPRLNMTEKIEFFLSNILKILRSIFLALQDNLKDHFRQQLVAFRSDFVDGKKRFYERFTHKFVFQFLRKLDNTVNGKNEGLRKLRQALPDWCNQMHSMLHDLPRESDIGADIFANMLFLKAQQETNERLKLDLICTLRANFKECQHSPFARFGLNVKFVEECDSIIAKIQYDSLVSLDHEGFGHFVTSLVEVGFKFDEKQQMGESTVWRALAGQFEQANENDQAIIEDQLRVAVADQILRWFGSRSRRAKASKLLKVPVEEFVCRLLQDSVKMMVEPWILEICLHFFLLCFGRSKASKIKGINIWTPSDARRPCYQVITPCDVDTCKSYGLKPQIRSKNSVIEMGSDDSRIHTLDIAIFFRQSESCERMLCFASLTCNRPSRPERRNNPSRRDGFKSSTDVAGLDQGPADVGEKRKRNIEDSIGRSEHKPNTFVQNFCKIISSANEIRVFVFDTQSLYAFQRETVFGKKHKGLSLIEMFAKIKQSDQILVLVIPLLVKHQIKVEAQNLKDPLICLDINRRNRAFVYSRIREVINTEYSTHNGQSNGVHFFLQDADHLQSTCGSLRLELADAILKTALGLKVKRSSGLDMVVVSEDVEAQGLLNQNSDTYKGISIISVFKLLKDYKLAIGEDPPTDGRDLGAIWNGSFGVPTSSRNSVRTSGRGGSRPSASGHGRT